MTSKFKPNELRAFAPAENINPSYQRSQNKEESRQQAILQRKEALKQSANIQRKSK